MPKARSSSAGTCPRSEPGSNRCCSSSSASRPRCRRCTVRSSTRVGRSTRYARAGETGRAGGRGRSPFTSSSCMAFDGETLRIRVRVSKGTYVRTLGAGHRHTPGLRCASRGRCGATGDRGADRRRCHHPGASSARCGAPERLGLLSPADMLVRSYPRLNLDAPWDAAIRRGQRVPAPRSWAAVWSACMTGSARFIGVGEVRDPGEVAPRRLVSEARARQRRGSALSPWDCLSNRSESGLQCAFFRERASINVDQH